jgi:hypothetical protein
MVEPAPRSAGAVRCLTAAAVRDDNEQYLGRRSTILTASLSSCGCKYSAAGP